MTTLLSSDGKADLIRDVASEWPTHFTFVETGTACGDLPLRLAPDFEHIVTIEMDPDYFASASIRLRPYRHIMPMLGDSAELLGPVLAANGPAIVFLDAHEVADAGDSALAAELAAIAHAPIPPVVLVDDARLCADARGWVSVDTMIGWADTHNYRWLGVASDIARMVPE